MAEEVARHLPGLAAKRGLDEAQLLAALQVMPIQWKAAADYQDQREEAEKRIAERDPDDWPTVALALKLDLPVWSQDKDLTLRGWKSSRPAICSTHCRASPLRSGPTPLDGRRVCTSVHTLPVFVLGKRPQYPQSLALATAFSNGPDLLRGADPASRSEVLSYELPPLCLRHLGVVRDGRSTVEFADRTTRQYSRGCRQ